MRPSPLVTTDWLDAHLGDADLRVLDGSWYLPGAARNAKAEYADAHIPGTAFFDIDHISDNTSDLPHMLPDATRFAREVEALGIGNGDLVVVYDGAGVYSAPRVWWMFQAMGRANCAVLDGGFPKWRREGRRVSAHSEFPKRGSFLPEPQPHLVRRYEDISRNLSTNAEQILDARSAPRFAGLEPEPRPGVKPGHIPGSTNLYYADLVQPGGTMRPCEALATLFAAKGIDLARPVVTSCGSGITAAIVYLAAALAGAKTLALYDGSWAEWGAKTGAPLATGPERT